MKIVILDGQDTRENKSWADYMRNLADELNRRGHEVNHHILMDKKIHACTGCFDCWVKTPGVCIIADDSREINRQMIQSDFVLWASPLVMGYPSYYLKNKMDRSIPLLHPYFDIANGEIHHRGRYEKYPLFGLLYQPGEEDQAVDLDIIEQMFYRSAINFHSRLVFALTTSQPVAEVTDAMDHAQNLAFFPGNMAVQSDLATVAPPKKLLIVNGSPRGEHGNTSFLLNKFEKGYLSVQGTSTETICLTKTKDKTRIAEKFKNADCVMVAFPLYVDGMPGIVKEFIEILRPFEGAEGNPPMTFLIQSGFPEAAHSRYVERYLQQLSKRLNSPYLGTLLRGGCGGVRLMPEIFNQKMFTALNHLGKELAEQGEFNQETIHRFASVERYSKASLAVKKITSKTPLMQFYWQGMLKQNKVFDQRFNQPYLESGEKAEKAA